MKALHLSAVAGICLALTGGVFAVQEGGRDPGERSATTTLITNDEAGDEISLTYRTLHFSPKPIEAMKTDPEARQGWARFLPQLLQATLNTDVELKWKDHTLPPGKYGISFGMTDAGAWELYLLRDERRLGRLPLATQECTMNHQYLSMNLMSAGANSFQLVMGYGNMLASVPFEAVAAEN